jgi:hypothetical protein
MWQGRSMTDGSLPAILGGYQNWWGDTRHLWDDMSDYRPSPGDEVDFLITAGNGRLVSGVTSVAERSNVVAIHLPAGDSGHFVFTPSAPPPVPFTAGLPTIIYVPTPAPLPATPIAAVPAPLPVAPTLDACRADIAALAQSVAAGRAENQSFFAAVGGEWKKIAAIAGPIVAAVIAGMKIAKP